MRILICDDEPLMCDKIESLINTYFQRRKVKGVEIARFHDRKSLTKDEGVKDIIFLDIEMPGMNGICAGNLLRENGENVIIIVITSYAEYLDDAMRFHVFRYLSKPIDERRFYRNLEDALNQIRSCSVKIILENGQESVVVSSKDILMVESANRKTIVHCIDADYRSAQKISFWVEKLPKENFIQSHRSFLVNLEYVSRFDNDMIYLSKNGLSAFLTRRKHAEFHSAYLLYLGRK